MKEGSKAYSIPYQYISLFFLTCITTSILFASLDDTRRIQAYKLNPDDIILDGILDEEVWSKAPTGNHFTQRDPQEGDLATETTEFSVLYDDEHLYIGIMAYDSNPDSIRAILSRRDEDSPSDWLTISFDSYNDNRTAFQFAMNPRGVKRDLRWYDDERQDLNWDALWEGETQISSQGTGYPPPCVWI